MNLSVPQQKSVLNGGIYTLTTNGRTHFGSVVGFAQDHRGFGAVVKYPNGTKFFYGVQTPTLTLVNLGAPPRRRKPRNTLRAFTPLLRLR